MSVFDYKIKRQVILLYSTSLLGVLVGVGVSVLNTRSLSVADYGDVRYVNNIINFVCSLLLLGYFVSGSRLLALSSDRGRSRKIYAALIVILCGAIILDMMAMLGCYFVHTKWLNPNVANLFLLAIPVCSAPLLLNFINTSFQGDNRIGAIAWARLFPSLLYLVVGFLIYQMYGASTSMMLLLQNGVAIIIYVLLIASTKPIFQGVRESILDLHKENKQYGFHVYTGSVAAISLSYLAGITLGIFNEDNTLVGFYTLALTITTPLSMLPSIVGTVFFKHFASENKIDRQVLIITLFLSAITLIVFVILIHPLVDILYDETYSSVAGIASFLAIGMTFHGLGDMFNRFLGAHGKGEWLRNGAVLCGFVMVTGNVILVYFWGINGAVLTKILSSAIYTFSMVHYYYRFKKQEL